jgi:hypothetical protein
MSRVYVACKGKTITVPVLVITPDKKRPLGIPRQW